MQPLYKWLSLGWLLEVGLYLIETVWLSFIAILKVLVMNLFLVLLHMLHMCMANTENIWDLLTSLASFGEGTCWQVLRSFAVVEDVKVDFIVFVFTCTCTHKTYKMEFSPSLDSFHFYL